MSSPFASPKRPLIHGHRGCRGLRPENTIPAFLHAVATGADVLELDVIISADAQVVVSHEPWPAALYCTAPDGRPVLAAEEQSHNFYRLPYAAIRAFDCGRRRHPSFPEQQTMPAHKPLLAEVIEAVDRLCQQLGRPSVGFSVEVKSSSPGDGIFHPAPAPFVELVLAVLQSVQALARTTLLSFDERILREARLVQPDLRLCLLLETPFTAAQLFDSLGFVPTALGPDYHLLDGPLFQQLRARYPSLELVPWTVNEPAAMQALIDWQVAGITTDYPDRLAALLATEGLV